VFSSALIIFLQLYQKKGSFACKNACAHGFLTYLPIMRSSNTHYKVFEHSRQQSASDTAQEKMSGTHSSNFFDFCAGHNEIYYMQRHLEAKPDIVATVVADLPDEVFIKKKQ